MRGASGATVGIAPATGLRREVSVPASAGPASFGSAGSFCAGIVHLPFVLSQLYRCDHGTANKGSRTALAAAATKIWKTHGFQPTPDAIGPACRGASGRAPRQSCSRGCPCAPDRCHATWNARRRQAAFVRFSWSRVRPCLGGSRRRRRVETASAVECVHCYSLAHDDLPAMDNDDRAAAGRRSVRRSTSGRPYSPATPC